MQKEGTNIVSFVTFYNFNDHCLILPKIYGLDQTIIECDSNASALK